MKKRQIICWHILPSNTQSVIYVLSFLFIVCGLWLMYGEGSDTETFRPEIFSIFRIKVAPMLCFVGYLLIGIGIMIPRKHIQNKA